MSFYHFITKSFCRLYTKYKIKKCKHGKHILIQPKIKLLGSKYITIGSECHFGPGCRIEAWSEYKHNYFSPEIVIGNDVRVNSTCHIGAINGVYIGDECLLGSHVTIIDHSHGKNSPQELGTHPSERHLYSKGKIIIGKRCWLCENVVVLPGVRIGDESIIGANAVVTKDIPSRCVAVGNPAHVVKKIPESEM